MPKQTAPKKGRAVDKKLVKKQASTVKKSILEPTDEVGFHIVALGASAGGLEAFEDFFRAVPAETGIAFILIAHLDPTHVSLLPELIQKETRMKVHKIHDGMKVQPNNAYVIPPNKDLRILNGILQLMEITQPRGANLPIDSFFRSLAADQGSNAICIILSGTGTDGTLGLKAIKEEVGMVMVQDEESAKYDGMPRSAISTGLADYVLSPEVMPGQLIKFTRHASQTGKPLTSSIDDKVPNALQKIYIILRSQTDHDFSLYKKNTICRRIERRMNVHQIDDIREYVRYLQSSEREVGILFKELLIGVTNFFRDGEIFDRLGDLVLHKLLEGKPNDYTIRVWVAGCSSGEEAYSLAILLKECMWQLKRHFNVQIFATDLDEDAIKVARAGIYPASIEADVSSERLKRNFTREEDGQYRINKSIREMLVFASQNIIKDPPFTKLDILSCRNLLIYLGPELQKKLLPIFHYSLKRDGILFLGSSETIGQGGTGMFSTLDKKGKIFRRKIDSGLEHSVVKFPTLPDPYEGDALALPDSIRKAEEISALQLVETILHQSNAPPCAIIDDGNNVVYVHGRTGHFLEPPEGRISVNILEMARADLKPVLSSAIRKVATHKQDVSHHGLEIENNGGLLYLDLTVKPILQHSVMHGLMMVIFDETRKPSKIPTLAPKTENKRQKAKTTAEVELELQYARENLQTTIEELETSNEELKSTNEELQSTNEELQSTNEEMETSKEELQSLNEESTTVNAELQSRIDELSNINDDMKNLLDSTEIATLFLDTDLCIRRFTPKATEIIPLAAADVGRSIRHFATILIDTDLAEFGVKVLRDLTIRETEVNSHDGRIHLMKVRPYRTVNNLIDGVIITFEDITERKRAEKIIEDSIHRYRVLIDLSRDSIVMVDALTGRIVESNRAAYESLGYTREEFDQLSIQDIDSVESPAEMLEHIAKIARAGGETFETRYKTKEGEICDVQIKAKMISISGKEYLLLIWYPITQLK